MFVPSAYVYVPIPRSSRSSPTVSTLGRSSSGAVTTERRRSWTATFSRQLTTSSRVEAAITRSDGRTAPGTYSPDWSSASAAIGGSWARQPTASVTGTPSLRAQELEARVVESLLATLKRRELLQDAVTRWMEDVAEVRPKRERELAAVNVRLRKVEDAMDRYFRAFEDGRLNEMLCAERIEALASEVGQLKARRSELEEEISAGRPEVLAPEDLAGLFEEVGHAFRSGPLPERKVLMQTLVAEIRVRDRSWIQPVFKVPVFRPPYGLVVPTGFEPVSPP